MLVFSSSFANKDVQILAKRHISTHFDAVQLDAETDHVLEWWGFVENLAAKRASRMLSLTEIWGKMSSFNQKFTLVCCRADIFLSCERKKSYFKSNHR